MSTPTLRPWRESEVPVGAVVQRKYEPAFRYMIVAVVASEVWLGGVRSATVQILFANYIMADGSPCGTTEP